MDCCFPGDEEGQKLVVLAVIERRSRMKRMKSPILRLGAPTLLRPVRPTGLVVVNALTSRRASSMTVRARQSGKSTTGIGAPKTAEALTAALWVHTLSRWALSLTHSDSLIRRRHALRRGPLMTFPQPPRVVTIRYPCYRPRAHEH